MEILPEDYMIPTDNSGVYCNLCIDDSGSEDFLLGDAFLRGFYSAYDHKEKRFGFAPHSLSTKKAPYAATSIPSTFIPTYSLFEAVILIVSGVLVFALIGLAIYFIQKFASKTAQNQRVSLDERVQIAQLIAELSTHRLLEGRLKIAI
jgi:hypothetical protein